MKALENAEVTAAFPTSANQMRCWVLEQIQPGDASLNLAIRWELVGHAPSEIIEAAFQMIVDRHEILRTRFIEQDGELVQEVIDGLEFKLNQVDIRNVPEAEQETRIQEIAREYASEPFDLNEPGLFRVAMIRQSPERAALLISVHHSVFDGYSIRVLGREMGLIAASLLDGREPDLPDLPLQYGDYAMWLRDFEESGALAEEEGYWVRQMQGMEYFELPADRPRTEQKAVLKGVARDLPADFDERISDAAKTLDVSVFTLGVAAASAALERASGRRDVSFATPAACRDDVDLEPLIGVFINPVVLRFDVDPDASLKDHVARARPVVEGALQHQHLPFDRLVQKLNPKRDPLRQPLASIMFNLQRVFLQEQSYGPFELRSVQSHTHSPSSHYDLSIAVAGRKSGWRLTVDYNANLFDEATADNIADMLVQMLDAGTRTPDFSITQLAPSDRPVRELRTVASPVEQQSEAHDRRDDNAAKTELAHIWADVLGLPAAAVDGDFFDLGGHSILSLRMFAKAEKKLGRRPPLQQFLADPTLSGLAEWYDQGDEQAAGADSNIWSLVELRSAGVDAPLLLSVNQTFLYRRLAGEMTADCTVANLMIADRTALSAQAESGFDAAMEEAARLVQARYGDRPLIVCGLCVDGRAALRLAQALEDLGGNPATVAMIDSWAPTAGRELSPITRIVVRWRLRLRRLRYLLGQLLQGKVTLQEFLQQYNFGVVLLRRFKLIDEPSEMEELFYAMVDQLVDQSVEHEFRPYTGEALIFVTDANVAQPKDGVMGWSGVLPDDTAIYRVAGWHGDALTRTGFDKITRVLDEKIRRL